LAQMSLSVWNVWTGLELKTFHHSQLAKLKQTQFLAGSDIQMPALKMHLAKEAISQVFDVLIPQLLKLISQLSWQGMITKKEGFRFYISAGKNSGFGLKEVLKVFSPGKEMAHPSTESM